MLCIRINSLTYLPSVFIVEVAVVISVVVFNVGSAVDIVVVFVADVAVFVADVAEFVADVAVFVAVVVLVDGSAVDVIVVVIIVIVAVVDIAVVVVVFITEIKHFVTLRLYSKQQQDDLKGLFTDFSRGYTKTSTAQNLGFL